VTYVCLGLSDAGCGGCCVATQQVPGPAASKVPAAGDSSSAHGQGQSQVVDAESRYFTSRLDDIVIRLLFYQVHSSGSGLKNWCEKPRFLLAFFSKIHLKPQKSIALGFYVFNLL